MFDDRLYRCYMDAVQHCSHVAAGDPGQGKKVAAIVVFTATGKTAQLLANQRPRSFRERCVRQQISDVNRYQYCVDINRYQWNMNYRYQ
jgi:pyruvate kinase